MDYREILVKVWRQDEDGWGSHRRHSALPPGELFSETNDNSVAILLTYGTTRVLLAGDAEVRREKYMAGGSYTEPLTVVRVHKYKNS